MSGGANRDRVVYLVTGWPAQTVNERVARLLELRPRFRRMTLVVRGTGPATDETLPIARLRNPFSMLRRARLNRLASAVEKLVLFPNRHVLYTVVARRRLAAALARDLDGGLAVTLVTCVPNHENTAIGLYLKTHFPRIHWVVDWQDLWSYDENYFRQVPPFYRGRLRRRERAVLERADRNVTTNEHARRVLRDVYGAAEARLAAIPHPIDPGLVPATDTWPEKACIVPIQGPRRRAGGPVTLGFLGSLFKPPRVPGIEVLAGLRALRSAGVDVELHLHGPVPAEVARCRPWLAEAGLVMEPHLSGDQFVRALQRYDYLLVVLADLPNSRAVMSIKLVQYLVSGRPILALVPSDSAVAELVRRARAGVVVPSEGDWREALATVLRGDAHERFAGADPAVVDQLSWHRLSDQWLEVLVPADRRISG